MRWLALLAALAAAPALAEDGPRPLPIGHLSLAGDARYVRDWGYARLIVPPPVLTEQAAAMGIDDLAFISDAAGVAPSLDVREGADLVGLQAALDAMIAAGAEFVVLDLPGALVGQIAAANADRPVTLINATAPEDALRRTCHPNLLHSGPSDRMLADAFAQHLRAMGWDDILVLVGEDPRDGTLADTFAASAERMRLRIADRRPFTLAANPEAREGNNVALLTGGVDYDVVFVADTRGEFGRFIPYATRLPRPVIGSIGLTAEAWHWALERDGATQVSSRFHREYGRHMLTADWAVWIAVKSVIQAATRVPGGDRQALTDYMRSHRMRLDGSKGVTLNYRSWDGQMRMPILLATADAVITIAPLEGFLHQFNTLDTLGTDEPEFACDD